MDNRIEIIILGFKFTDFQYHHLSKQDNISNVFACTIRKSNPTVVDVTISSTVNLKPCCSIKTSTILAIRDYYNEFKQIMAFALIEYAAQNSLQAYRILIEQHCGFVPNMPEVTIDDLLPRLDVNSSTINPLSN